jgi:hypothetical protein
VRVGSRQSVVVRGDDNLLDRVVTRVRDGELTIAGRGNFATTRRMGVDVTVPVLDDVALTGPRESASTGSEAATDSALRHAMRLLTPLRRMRKV